MGSYHSNGIKGATVAELGIGSRLVGNTGKAGATLEEGSERRRRNHEPAKDLRLVRSEKQG